MHSRKQTNSSKTLVAEPINAIQCDQTTEPVDFLPLEPTPKTYTFASEDASSLPLPLLRLAPSLISSTVILAMFTLARQIGQWPNFAVSGWPAFKAIFTHLSQN